MAYTILRFAKQKGNPARAIQAHHEREKEKYKSNPDINLSKSRDNIHLITPQMSYKKEVDSRISKSGCRVERTVRGLLIHSSQQVPIFSRVRAKRI